MKIYAARDALCINIIRREIRTKTRCGSLMSARSLIMLSMRAAIEAARFYSLYKAANFEYTYTQRCDVTETIRPPLMCCFSIYYRMISACAERVTYALPAYQHYVEMRVILPYIFIYLSTAHKWMRRISVAFIRTLVSANSACASAASNWVSFKRSFTDKD